MYKIAKIIFKPKSADLADIPDKIDEILGMLHKNGQILDWIIEDHATFFVATVSTTDDDSLEERYFNQYIRHAIGDFDTEIEIVSDDALASDCCHCADHSYYIFAIYPDLSSSPVWCGDCGNEIPLTRIPYLYGEEEHYSILNFQQMYKAVDTLWMDSLSDRFTKRQLVSHKSELNKRGMEIRAELERRLDKPVYYLLANPIGGWYELEKNNKHLEVCPKCGGELEAIDHACANKVCQKCRFAFVDPEE
jgi:predicted  nucleic acid-binding Zn ribbon protein